MLPILCIGVWLSSPWALEEVHPSFSAVLMVLWLTALVLGWRLHRTRIVFASTAIGVLVQGFALWGSSTVVPAVQMGASLFFAVALVCFGFAGDRGLSTPSGVLRFTVLVVAAGLTAWFCLPEQAQLIENLYRPFVAREMWEGIETPQLAIVVSVCSSVDAFLALGFSAQVTPGALLAFLLLGPVVDLKLAGLFTVLLRPRAIAITATAASLGVLLIGQWVNLWQL